ncbi:hypothetical protein ACFLQ2_04260 [archaeon]
MRRILYTVVLLAVLLPGVFCAEAGTGGTLEQAVGVARLLSKSGGVFMGAFSMLAAGAETIDGAINIGQFHTTLMYDSAIVPSHTKSSYFIGIETKTGTVEDYTVEAWADINSAKANYAKAQISCPFSPECYTLVQKITTELADSNAKAGQAGALALKETESALNELGQRGGDLSEYGGEPFDAYSGFTTEYEKPGGRYGKFQQGLQGYAFIETNGDAIVQCDATEMPGVEDYRITSLVGGPVLVYAHAAYGFIKCLDIKPSALATQYHHSYNLLVGASDWGSGIREMLGANKRLRDAILLMDNEHTQVKKELGENTGLLRQGIGTLEKEGAGKIDYSAVEAVVGKMAQTPAELLASAKESQVAIGLLGREADRLLSLKQDNWLALSTIRTRQASEEASHAASLAEHGGELLDEMLDGLSAACEQEAEKARGQALENGLFSAAKVEEAAAKCKGADKASDAVGLYLDGIRELKFISATGSGKAELALLEIQRLETMISKAGSDFSVEEETLALEKAREYAKTKGVLGSESGMLDRAYDIAIAAQESIWSKAGLLFGGLGGERLDAKQLMKKMREVEAAGYRGLDERMVRMDGIYRGAIDLESLGHLREAKELYGDVREAALEALDPEELVSVIVDKEYADVARCNQVVPVHYSVSVKNPYGFAIEDGFDVEGIYVEPLGPYEERAYTGSADETPLWCGATEEKVLWVYPDRETRVASRQIEAVGLEKAVVVFQVEGALAVEAPGALVPEGIEIEAEWPGNETVEFAFEAESSMKVVGPACESYGSQVNCRYVLTLGCGQSQKVNIVLPRPLGISDSVSASSGRAQNAGSIGIIISGADCPGYSTVDIGYIDLREDSEEVMRKIEDWLEELGDSSEKDSLEKRHESLKGKSPSEIISRGGELLGDIEAELARQKKEQIAEHEKLGLELKKPGLENWLLGRGFSLPWLPSDTATAISELEKAKAAALKDLGKRYAEASERVAELKNTARLLEKFGLKSPAIASVEKQFPTPHNEYQEFAMGEAGLLQLMQNAEDEAERLASEVKFVEVQPISGLEQATDTQVEIEDPSFVIGERYAKEVLGTIGELAEASEKGTKKVGGLTGLKALDKDGLYPAELEKEYADLEKSVVETIGKATGATSARVELALEEGEGHYSELAKQSLENGYVNRAYAYATHALESEGKSPATGLVTSESALLFLAPLGLIAVVWQLRKKKKLETPVQRAIRLTR